MAKVKNSYEAMARKADERLAKVRGRQLSMLPDEPGADLESVAAGKPVGRPKGAVNKGSSQLRKWLEVQGYKMPEDVLVQLAGLDDPAGPVMRAMAQVEEVLAWAFDGAKDGNKQPREASPEQRVQLLVSFLAIQERAVVAMLPYGTPRAGTDAPAAPLVSILMGSGGAAGGDPAGDAADQARDVTPDRAGMDARMVPADVVWEMQRNQPVREDDAEGADE